MIKSRLLFLLIGLSFLLAHLPASYGMQGEDGDATRIGRSSPNKSEEDNRSHHPVKPDCFYRNLQDNVTAIYANQVLFNGKEDIDLFKDSLFIKPFIWNREGQFQYLGVVFFGIWRDVSQNTFQLIEVPIKNFWDTRNFKKENENPFEPLSINIWRTKNGPEELQKSGVYTYEICPCMGKHTEPYFFNFVQYSSNLNTLWEYFKSESDQEIKANEKELRLVGFKFYSTFDACDECFKRLFDLQTNPETILSHLLPEQKEVPFQILFHAKKFYNPGGNNAGGTTLYYKPCSSAQPLWVKSVCPNPNGYEDECQKIHHEEAIQIPENKQHNFVIIKINEGEDTYVPK